LLAGDPNSTVHELWYGKGLRSFDQVDGLRRISDLVAVMHPVIVNGQARHVIYPGKDERFLRIVRKIIRGLSHFHEVLSPVADHRVWADVLTFQVPKALLDQMPIHHREMDIFQYRYQVLEDGETNINSAWLMKFFGRTELIGIVTQAEQGFVEATET
jgi:hypothetical protein